MPLQGSSLDVSGLASVYVQCFYEHKAIHLHYEYKFYHYLPALRNAFLDNFIFVKHIFVKHMINSH